MKCLIRKFDSYSFKTLIHVLLEQNKNKKEGNQQKLRLVFINQKTSELISFFLKISFL